MLQESTYMIWCGCYVGIITAPSLQDPRQALALSLGTISLPCRDFIPPDFCSQASSNIKYHSCM